MENQRDFCTECRSKDGEFHRDGEITPVEFWQKYVGSADLESYVCLVDDPRQEHAKGKKIGIEHLGNVAGGDPTAKSLIFFIYLNGTALFTVFSTPV